MEPTVQTRSAAKTAELEAVRRRRAELRESINALEQALASPAVGRPLIWGERVRAVLAEVADDVREHIEVTEGPNGLHQAILAGDLRLANAVNALSAEHESITAEVADLITDTEPPVTVEDVADVRERATRMLGHLIRHRQRGADLIFEAYDTDIGGGD
jgi:cell division protein FtsB